MTFSILVSNATVLLGDSVILPCWLSPATDAEKMEVRWFRTDYNNPVLLYPDNKDQMEQYQNRTALTPREPSGGLKQGDVSIRIEHVTLKDAGKYVCYVSGSEHYDSDSVFLKVEGEFGTHLFTLRCELLYKCLMLCVLLHKSIICI